MKSNPIQLVDLVEEKRKPGRFSLAVLISAIVHTLLMAVVVYTYEPINAARVNVPIRYVELIQQDPKEFVEAPGRKVEQKPLNAPYSDANRRASGPNPTPGMPETKMPGDGSGLYTPSMGDPRPRGPQPGPATPAVQQQRPSVSQQASAFPPPSGSPQPQLSPDQMAWRQQTAPQQSQVPRIDVNQALGDLARATRSGGGQGMDLSRAGGGEKGFYEQGPLSFETQWFDWGDYAQGMVSRIRVNWYAGMPQLIRTGMQGRVVIRFTIHRDGRISDVTILESSGVPPYDHAARKAIEQSSPLNPLPKGFPNETERVTCAFYYNMQVPR